MIAKRTTEGTFVTDTSIITHLVMIEMTDVHTTIGDQDIRMTAGITINEGTRKIGKLIVGSQQVMKGEMTIDDLSFHDSSNITLLQEELEPQDFLQQQPQIERGEASRPTNPIFYIYRKKTVAIQINVHQRKG